MRLPDKGSVYDYAWNAGGWVPWSSMMGSSSEFRIEANARIQEIIVPTIDSARYTILTQLFARARIPGLFVGPTGTGKSAYITKALAAMNKDAYAPLVISFSAQTSASQTREIIDAKLVRGTTASRHLRTLIGRAGSQTERRVRPARQPHLRDLHRRPEHAKAGAIRRAAAAGAAATVPGPRRMVRAAAHTHRARVCACVPGATDPPCARARYDVGDASFRTMLDTTVVCAMGPPGGGRNPITSRLTRHFSHVTMTPFDDASLTTIFTAILHWHLGRRSCR